MASLVLAYGSRVASINTVTLSAPQGRAILRPEQAARSAEVLTYPAWVGENVALFSGFVTICSLFDGEMRFFEDKTELR